MRRALTSLLLLPTLLWIAPATSWAADSFPVIGPNHEDDIQEALAPIEVEGPVEGGFVLTSVTMDRTTVVFRLDHEESGAWVEIVLFHGEDPGLPEGAVPLDDLAYVTKRPAEQAATVGDAAAQRIIAQLTENASDVSDLWDAEGIDPSLVSTEGGGGGDWASFALPGGLPDAPILYVLNARNIIFGVLGLLLLLVLLSGLPAFLRRKKS